MTHNTTDLAVMVEQLQHDLDEKEARIEKLERALHKLDTWSRAYPLEVFPEPNFTLAAALLKAGGQSLGAVSASNMRHLIVSVGEIVREALEP